MTDLTKRLEEAEAGSLELDVTIWGATGGWSVAHPPAFTTSLDAALALAERVLPEGWTAEIKTGARPFHRAIIHPKYQMENKQDRCPMGLSKATPALALCIAILKATDTGREA
jgi:hypothetical protein